MSISRRKAAAALVALAISPIATSAAWALNEEAQAAKDEGMRLWGISEWIKMQPYLEQAAEAGDVEALYYLGEATRLLDRGLSQRAMAWYLQAAEQGDVHAMLRLFQGGACTAGDRCPEGYEDWHHAALAVAQPQAEAGDPDSMLAMFDIYRMFDQPRRAGDWLERAAEAGQPEAQTILGNQILDGRGWYLTNGRRLSAAEEWFHKAAEQGYVPAISRMADVLRRQGDYQLSWEWMKKASLSGNYDSRLGVGWCYLDPQRDDRCQNEQEKIQGWAILHALSIEMDDTSARSVMEWNEEQLPAEERREAEELAGAEWIGREPPLSRFPSRFGY
ncbi:tetratricopeptide repeat protein [Billgrantia antri]|uniref:Sel1 repeat family protein n=1 Tax=Billgrantia antri TaxID=2846777 RepID=A0ABS6ZUH0_9GAMM|nr:tetratricopeptide repeat protein [Halomonas antri]MBW6393518.1 sel1 repeat family protein [Halomonas antri]